jgi:hypothetical protein
MTAGVAVPGDRRVLRHALVLQEGYMRAFALFVILLLVIPMTLLNPLGRDAFLGYYLGVIATWAAYVIASRVAARPQTST